MMFEDFTKLYGRWSSGTKRKEDGTEVKTPYGTMILKDRSCRYEILIYMLLNNISEYFYMLDDAGFSREEMSNVMNCKAPYDYPLGDLKNGVLCVRFLSYEEAVEDYIESDEYCKDDYIEICRCLAKYLMDNVEICQFKYKQGDYRLLLYSGDLPDEFNFNKFRKKFVFEFNIEVQNWWNSREEYIGVEINYANVKIFKKMKDFVLNYIGA